MAIDPISAGGARNFGPYVAFVPVPIPGRRPDQPSTPPPPARTPGANPHQPGAPGNDPQPRQRNDLATDDAAASARAAAAAREQAAARMTEAAQAFAMEMALETLSAPLGSSSAAIARKLPGSAENVFAMTESLREEEKIVETRRELARKMARKDDEMNYRE